MLYVPPHTAARKVRVKAKGLYITLWPKGFQWFLISFREENKRSLRAWENWASMSFPLPFPVSQPLPWAPCRSQIHKEWPHVLFAQNTHHPTICLVCSLSSFLFLFECQFFRPSEDYPKETVTALRTLLISLPCVSFPHSTCCYPNFLYFYCLFSIHWKISFIKSRTWYVLIIVLC